MVIRPIVAILIIGAAGIYAGMLRQERPVMDKMPALERVPRELDGWSSEDFASDEATARVLAADATLHRCFRREDGAEVWLFVAYFKQQQVNAQIHSPRHCIPGGGWTINVIEQRALVLNGRAIPVTHMRTARRAASQEILYWFRTYGRVTADEYALKWEQVRNSILRRPSNAVFVRYSAATADSVALREVMTQLDVPLSQILGEVGLQ
jgi:EpsI family protein